MSAADEWVAAEVASWPGVERGDDFRYAGRAFGQIDGGVAELRFRPRVAAMLVETGRAEPHPDPRRVVFRLSDDEDAREAVELFRLAYERARVDARVRAARR